MPATPPRVETESPERIRQLLLNFLAAHPQCVLLEAGEVLFDMVEAHYTIDNSPDKVILHLWSEERNQVRRVVSAVQREDVLRLKALRFGQKEPESLELVSQRTKRVPATTGGTRTRFLRTLERVLRRTFPDQALDDLRASMDLEHSFGPAYARGLQRSGQRAWAVIGVGAEETAATIDGVLTIGILWLARCRERVSGRQVVEGLRVIVPKGMAATTLARMAWLDARIAKFALFELDAASETLDLRDARDHGNLATRLMRAPDESAATDPAGRFAAALPTVLALLPEAVRGSAEMRPAAHRRACLLPEPSDGFEMRLRSSAELAFLRHGLEFARIRMSFGAQSFNRELQVTVGAGPQETLLTDRNAGEMRARIAELFARRSAVSPPHGGAPGRLDPLFRLQPERWLESLLRADLSALDPQLEREPAYVQVPAVAGASDRGMLDLLAVTIDRRLAVIEIKADEDLQLAMQGLDYWIRVRDHHLANVDPATGLGDLQRLGYFPETRLRSEPPLLFLVAPALRIHPSTETILRHFDPRVEWTLVALDERWRTRVRPVWRRRSSRLG